ATPNGGGFGGKSDPFHHEVVVCKAAVLLDRPVKICLNREEVFYCHRGRHPVLMHFKTGVRNDGSITGLQVRTLLDGGAYGSSGCRWARVSASPARRICRAPACRFTGTTCRTLACSSNSIEAAASRRSAAPPKSGKAPTTCWSDVWLKSSASIRWTFVRSRATPTSRPSIWDRTRAASP